MFAIVNTQPSIIIIIIITPQNGPLSLEILCMHFILSSRHISSLICNHICHKKFATSFSKREGGVEGRLEFFQKIIRFGSGTLPLVGQLTSKLQVDVLSEDGCTAVYYAVLGRHPEVIKLFFFIDYI